MKVVCVQVRNKKTNLCLDTMGKKSGERVAITPCHGQGGNQVHYGAG